MVKGDRSLDVTGREVREMRNAEPVLGIIRIAEDTGELGAPKGARPVRGGADGKVLTE